MGLTYPKYGRRQVRPTLVSRDQVEEQMTTDQKERLGGFGLREVGAPYQRSARVVPGAGFLEGAVFESMDVFRPTGDVPED